MSVETLLQHRAWVRDLARRLVGDAHLADDVEQQTWLAALRSPPRGAQNLRGWLATVVRNAARKAQRSGVRRRRHEGAAGAAATTPPAVGVADTVARAEVHRRLVAAVMELPESQRDVVLLRTFDGLPPREVARRLGVPVATVRTRMRRALATLRGRLDADQGGRRAWLIGMGALARMPDGPATATGGLASSAGTGAGAWLMALATKHVLLGAAALAALGVAFWQIGRDTPPDPTPPISVADVGDEESDAPTRNERRRAEPATPAAGSSDIADTPAGGAEMLVRVRVGADPAAGARVVLLDEGGSPSWSGRTDAEGRARAAIPVGDVRVAVALDGHPVTVETIHAGTVLHEVVLPPDATLDGIVRVDGAAPAAPLVLSFGMVGAGERVPAKAWGGLAPHAPGGVAASTGAGGRFAFGGLTAGEPGWLELPDGFVLRDTFEPALSVTPPRSSLVLDLVRLPRVTGRVVGPDGRPVPWAQVGVMYAGEDEEGGIGSQAEEDGSFAIDLPVRSGVRLVLQIADENGVGETAIEVPDGRLDLGDVTLGASRTVRLRAVDVAGGPVVGAVAMAVTGGVGGAGVVAGDDGRMDVQTGTGPALLAVTARGRALAVVDASSGDDVRDVVLHPGTELVLELSGVEDRSGWAMVLEATPPLVLRRDLGDAAGDLELAAPTLFAAAGATLPRSGGLGAAGLRFEYGLDDSPRVVVLGILPGVDVAAVLRDPSGTERARHQVTLASAERRTVRLAPDRD